MASDIDRRDFLASAPAAMLLASRAWQPRSPETQTMQSHARLEPFDYQRVRLRPSRWKQQADAARDFYAGVPDDDILHGFRKDAGQPAPGTPLGGWCGRNSNTVFGQWLSGMARMFRATGDARMRDKAVELVDGVGQDDQAGRRRRHAPLPVRQARLRPGRSAAVRRLRRRRSRCSRRSPTSRARRSIARTTSPTRRTTRRTTACRRSGTRSQRTCSAPTAPTGNPKFKTFGEAWLYHAWWNKFANTSAPADAHGVHAYSHVNTFSSAAMAYDVLGDASYLDDPSQRLRLPAADAVLRDRRLRPQRALHGAGRQPRARARNAIRHR